MYSYLFPFRFVGKSSPSFNCGFIDRLLMIRHPAGGVVISDITYGEIKVITRLKTYARVMIHKAFVFLWKPHQLILHVAR